MRPVLVRAIPWMLLVCLAPLSVARAHISLEQAGTHRSRYGDDEIKDGPCGRANGKRGTNVYEYKPGQKITIKVKEFVGHPGYFRIAFDNDGDDGFLEPKSIVPITDPKTGEPFRDCLMDGVEQCGKTDFNNNSTVLMDNLDPHLAGFFNQKTYTWEVTLPNVTCENCTLQIIQVMMDNDLHGPYSPKGISKEGASYVEDIYHTCIDIKLKADASDDNNPEPPADAGDGDDDTGDGDSGDGDSGDGDGDSGDGDGDGDSHSGDGDHQHGSNGGPQEGAKDSGCSVGVAGPDRASGLLVLFGLLSGASLARRYSTRGRRRTKS